MHLTIKDIKEIQEGSVYFPMIRLDSNNEALKGKAVKYKNQLEKISKFLAKEFKFNEKDIKMMKPMLRHDDTPDQLRIKA